MYESASYTRPKLDRALAGPAFTIDELACHSAAKTLRVLSQMRPKQQMFGFRSQFLFRLCLSAICHQINWDFLSSRLLAAFQTGQIDPTSLQKISAREVQVWLDGYSRPERIRASERALLLRDVGDVLVEQYGADADNLILRAEGRLMGTSGLLYRLDQFIAFREDPLRKKSNVLVHDVVRDGVANFLDQDQILPAIDYHIMRLYLRSGRVAPLHRTTMDLFRRDSAPRPRLVKLLREAVSQALATTAFYADLSIPEINGLEWEIGRSICERAHPRCLGPADDGSSAFLMKDGRCPNISFCRAFTDPDWKELREPDSTKRFY